MKYALLILVTFFWSKLFSQVNHSISLGPDLGIPSKNFGTRAQIAVGGSFNYEAKFQIPVGIRFHIGYIKFSDEGITNSWVSFLPIRGGLAGYIYEDLIFVFVEAGVSRYRASTTTKQNGFSFGGGVGYKLYFNLDKKQFVQVSASYNLHNFKTGQFGQDYNYTWFSIGAAYGISLGKKSNK
jgi:hypothetical protein